MNLAWYAAIGLAFALAIQTIRLETTKLDLQVCQSDKKLAEDHAVGVRKQQALVTTQVITQYKYITQNQKVKDEAIQTEADSVPVLKLSRGFVRVHDAAARGEPTETASRVDDSADSTIDARAAAKTIATNYAACRADQTRLASLQQWVQEQFNIEPQKMPDG